MKFIIFVLTLIVYINSETKSKLKKNLQNITNHPITIKNRTLSENKLDFGDILTGISSFNQDMTSTNDNSSKMSRYDSDYKEPKEYRANCFLRMKRHLYDFTPLSQSCLNGTIKLYDFTFCRNILVPQCNRSGLFVNKAECKIYAGTNDNEKIFEMRKNNTGIKILLPKGEICDLITKEKFQIIYDIKCDKKASNLTILNPDKFDPNNCTNTIKILSQYSCPNKPYIPWYNNTGLDKSSVAYILICSSLIFLVLGEKLFDLLSAGIIGTIGGFFIAKVLSNFTSVNYLVVIIVSIVVIYLIFGFLHGFIVMIMGIIVGLMITNIIYSFEMKFINLDPDTVYFITVGILCLLGCIIAKNIDKLIIILATSLIGAYLFVRGFSILLGGYPEEYLMFQLLQHKEKSQVNRVFNELKKIMGTSMYTYLLCMLAVGSVGFLLQYGIKSDEKEKNNESLS